GPFDPVRYQNGFYMTGVEPMPRLDPPDRHLVDVRVTLPQSGITPGQGFACQVTVRNRSPFTLNSVGCTLVSLSYHWVDTEGYCVVWDGDGPGCFPSFPPMASTPMISARLPHLFRVNTLCWSLWCRRMLHGSKIG